MLSWTAFVDSAAGDPASAPVLLIAESAMSVALLTGVAGSTACCLLTAAESKPAAKLGLLEATELLAIDDGVKGPS